jgi:RNA polymerase sigma factor for flagellar operon FliA
MWAHFWADRSNQKVRVELAEAYEFVVTNVIRKASVGIRTFWERGDLHALGYIGLLESIDHFAEGSPEHNFAGYASTRVRGTIIDENRTLDLVPRSVRDDITRVRNATEQLTFELGTQPRTEEITAAAGLDAAKGNKVLATMHSLYFLHLDQLVQQGDSVAPAREFISSKDEGPEATVVRRSATADVRAALLKMPERDRTIIALRHLGRLTQEDVAKLMGLTHSRICQIEKKALEVLRSMVEEPIDAETLSAAI